MLAGSEVDVLLSLQRKTCVPFGFKLLSMLHRHCTHYFEITEMTQKYTPYIIKKSVCQEWHFSKNPKWGASVILTRRTAYMNLSTLCPRSIHHTDCCLFHSFSLNQRIFLMVHYTITHPLITINSSMTLIVLHPHHVSLVYREKLQKK
jgi:hypothetical protein